jgi:hypothetical protein
MIPPPVEPHGLAMILRDIDAELVRLAEVELRVGIATFRHPPCERDRRFALARI